ncbi:hypothetical protein BT63DRAFT_420345 [Microthyrium microscopicum]|uniref:Uncharacterized protein n=1 Tax=Microthyrium microscopicum TaxID=703497 RepID=A0A6A6UVL3_9PEZI|nr:hypothetical protein BT63DRAFT_420345 [Microthyrium microscopicum]
MERDTTIFTEQELRDIVKTFSVPANKSPSWNENILASLLKAIRTASSPDVNGNQAAVGISAVSAILQSQKENPALRSALWENQLWVSSLNIYVLKLDSVKGKSLRHLLGVLLDLLRISDLPQDTKSALLQDITRPLLGGSARTRVKASLSILNAFLLKEIISIPELLGCFQSFREDDDMESDQLADYRRFFAVLFRLVSFDDLAPVAGNFSATCWRILRSDPLFLDAAKSKYADERISMVWIEPLLSSIQSSGEGLMPFKHHMFPEMLTIDINELYFMLELLGARELLSRKPSASQSNGKVDDETRRAVVLAALQVGKEHGMIVEGDSSIGENFCLKDRNIYISSKSLKHLGLHLESAARLSGLSLIASSPSTIKPISGDALATLRQIIPFIFSENDAGARDDLLSTISKLVARFNAILFHYEGKIAKSLKKSGNPKDSSSFTEANLVVESHTKFIGWFAKLIITELRPEARYPRLIFSLKCLSLFLKLGLRWETMFPETVRSSPSWAVESSTRTLCRKLADLLMNPFEDIRSLSASLLEKVLLGHGQGFLDHHDELQSALGRAELKMLRSGRADHADGFARLSLILFKVPSTKTTTSAPSTSLIDTKLECISQLVQSLDQALQTAGRNMGEAIAHQPLHGLLLTLKYTLEDSQLYTEAIRSSESTARSFGDLQATIVQTLERVWVTVRDVLCNDAPEGHVPMDIDVEELSLTTKDILSYSWRALKEASGVIRTLVLKASISKAGTTPGCLLENDFDKLTQLTFDALTQLRHRGAFSAVALAFAACCERNSRESRLTTLGKLYDQTLTCLRQSGSTITRRSAGIPPLMVGILSVDVDGSLLKRAIHDLQSTAKSEAIDLSEGGSLPQVHALNCLKAIFTTSNLAGVSEVYIPEAIDLAGQCVNSKIWAIRNCGLMLFKSIIDRLLGSTESQNWSDYDHRNISRISWSKYPALQTTVFQLLQTQFSSDQGQESGLESVFLALKIIQRIPPPIVLVEKIRNVVLPYCDSTHWHVRDMAARTLSTLTTEQDVRVQVFDLLTECSTNSQNLLHGRLLCILYTLKRCAALDKSSFGTIHVEILLLLQGSEKTLLHRLLIDNRCPFTQNAYLELFNFLLSFNLINRLNRLDLKGFQDERTTKFLDFIISNSNGNPILQKSAFIYRLLTDEVQSIHSAALINLAQTDANAATWVLLYVQDLLEWLPSTSLQVIEEASISIQQNCTENELLQTAEATLSLMLDLDQADSGELPQSNFRPDANFWVWAASDLPPSRMETSILLWARTFCKQNHTRSDHIWLSLQRIRSATHEESAPEIRLNATKALEYLYPLVRSENKPRQKLLILLYDCLNDDDEEIRDCAALIAAKVAKSATPVVPLAANFQLAATLAREFPRGLSLGRAAIGRMLDVKFDSNHEIQPSAASRYSAVAVESMDLFAVEKQNLYVDAIRESDIWKAVLKRMLLRRAPIEKLFDWTIEGLQLVNSHKHDHGWITWASKPDVFTFVWQLVNATEVLLQLCLNLRWMQRENMRLRLLEEIMKLDKTVDHPDTRQKIGLVLEKHVIRRLKLVESVNVAQIS